MAIGGINVGQELLNVPMGKMIQQMATAIAEAQWDLDKSSMTVTELMSGQRILRDLDTGEMINPQNGAPRILDSRIYFGYTYQEDPNEAGAWQRVPNKVSMMELGFTPTFYQFVDTIIEVKIAIKITGTTETVKSSSSGSTDSTNSNTNNYSYGYSGTNYYNRYSWYGGGYNRYSRNYTYGYGNTKTNAVQTSQVDASYSNKYSYSVEGASLLRTKLTPVPPPSILVERIQDVMELEREFQDRVSEGLIAKINNEPVPAN